MDHGYEKGDVHVHESDMHENADSGHENADSGSEHTGSGHEGGEHGHEKGDVHVMIIVSKNLFSGLQLHHPPCSSSDSGLGNVGACVSRGTLP